MRPLISDKSQADRRVFHCKRCSTNRSLRFRSFFMGYRLTLIELTRLIIHYFINKISIKETVSATGVSYKTISKLFATVREYISDIVRLGYEDSPLGVVAQEAPNEDDQVPVVEMDESLFSHFGRQQVWVFGIFDRGSNEIRAWVVRDRSAGTLLRLVQDHLAED